MTDSTELVWRALADPVRREILDALARAPLTTGDLVDRFDDLCRTAVMKHLDVLVAADLVLIRREGRFRWNYLNPVPIERICARWVNRHVRQLSSAMNRLKDVVESPPIEAATEEASCQTTRNCTSARSSTNCKFRSKHQESASGAD